GFNVGIVAFIINLLLKIMRIRRKARIILTVACLLIYCLATGATNPVIRATVMGIIFLLAYIFKREPDMYNSLASAALFILIINPRQLFDVGFQLSFASVLAIVYLYPKLRAFSRIAYIRVRILRFICEGSIVSFSAWVGTMGIIVYNFRIIAPVTILANILIVPLATLITLCGFALVLCGLFCPFLAGIFGTTTAMLITLLLNINAAVIRIPGAYFIFDFLGRNDNFFLCCLGDQDFFLNHGIQYLSFHIRQGCFTFGTGKIGFGALPINLFIHVEFLVNISLVYLFTIHDGSDCRTTFKGVGNNACKKQQRRTTHHDQEHGQDRIDFVSALTRFRRGSLLVTG
ncbi:MAG: ComEC/Rec2 family competence protein, partial [Bacteroidota bacterium]